ncbi:SHOCT domain-containing protein [Paraglaciecola aquimarina]|uniref:SHOCT domain-containing protein n=1 Tax=Paraglaciecola aquimarina TaxID=1235557 RepID=A0ABU3SXG7_9ALTE|nr:SHOCT domain-containing protein [Paraglaciecola aquimarina]MDU0354701.1 SHOCT domain-containing protein [Paraglaciecola aquimarina]
MAPAPQSNFAQPTQHSHDHAHDMGTENTSPNVVTPVSNSISAANAQSTHSKNGLANTSSLDDIIQLIEKLAKLRDAGAITDEDYNGKKAELLSRI